MMQKKHFYLKNTINIFCIIIIKGRLLTSVYTLHDIQKLISFINIYNIYHIIVTSKIFINDPCYIKCSEKSYYTTETRGVFMNFTPRSFYCLIMDLLIIYKFNFLLITNMWYVIYHILKIIFDASVYVIWCIIKFIIFV